MRETCLSLTSGALIFRPACFTYSFCLLTTHADVVWTYRWSSSHAEKPFAKSVYMFCTNGLRLETGRAVRTRKRHTDQVTGVAMTADGLGYRDVFSGPEAIQCFDLWEMQDGYHVTITNRLEDLPAWFRLHPTEVCDSFVYKMMGKVEMGDYPSEPMEAPNLWRLKSGDRVAWVGDQRPDRRPVNGVLAVLDCRESALAVGVADWDSVEEFAGFGAPTTPEMNPITLLAAGLPSTLSRNSGFRANGRRVEAGLILVLRCSTPSISSTPQIPERT
jgi:hypothetical protein